MSAESAETPVLEVRHLRKAFPGVQALDDVQFDVRAGEVHAVMGENGAGKSTLMKILAGLEQPDQGQMRFKGEPRRFRTAHEALEAGIAMIHQELMPFPDLSIAENIFMGREPAGRWPGWIAARRQADDTRRLLGRLGVAWPPETKVRELSVSGMQLVEIAKAIARRAEVIILDEPTSALSAHEIEVLFQLIGDFRRRGVAVIYITHKLDEVFRLADRITVLRDGRWVSTDPAAGLTAAGLISRMVGRELNSAFVRAEAAPGEETLAVRGLTKEGKFRNLSFAARRGEILGIAGLMGAGRTEVLQAIYGLAPADRGEIRVRGRPIRVTSPREAIGHGIGMVGEDRRESGLVLNLSVKMNLTLSNLRRCCAGGLIRGRLEARLADELIRAHGIRTPNRDQRAENLSGGNQQKIVIAKALFTEAQILLFDEPTRGIDIGAKREIYAILSRLKGEGRTILLVSSELPEILAVSDRILVMRGGEISAELDPRRSSEEEILRCAMPR